MIEVPLNVPTLFPKPKDLIGAQGPLKFHKKVPANYTAGSLGESLFQEYRQPVCC